MTTSCRDMVNVYSVITPTSSSFTHSLSQHSSLSSALHRLVAPSLPETFRKIRRATVPYRCVPNETTFYRENQISGIHNKCVSMLCTLCYLFIWEKKIDFYKRKLKLADLLCLLQCVVCLRRVFIVLNGKSKLTARTPVYYSI